MAKKEEAPKKESEEKAEAAPEAAGEQPAKTAKKRKLILFGGIGGALVLVLGIGGFFTFKALSKPKVELAAKDAHGDDKKADASHGDGKSKSDAKSDGKDASKDDSKDASKDAPKGAAKDGAKGDGHGADAAKKDDHGKKEEKKDDGHGKKDDHGASGSKDGDKKPSEGENTDTKKVSTDFGEIHELPKMDLNLGNPLENRFLRLMVTIEYQGKDSQKEDIKRREPQIKDIIITAVSAKSRMDLLSEKGKERLRRELTNRFNEVLEKPIKSIYFTEFLVE